MNGKINDRKLNAGRKLHLHLGAHKTATSHFQAVLASNKHRFTDHLHFEPTQVLRENLRWNGNEALLDKSIDYLNKIAKKDLSTLIISEENILGETKDIFKYKNLYGGAIARLQSMKFFYEEFDEIEIWLGIRSLNEFIPSIYAEYLRHFKFRRFSKVYTGYYTQSWVPLVKSLRNLFSEARINILIYDNYQENLPFMIKRMSELEHSAVLLKEKIIHPSVSSRAINLYHYAHWFIPRKSQSKVLDTLGKWTFGNPSLKKFSPFTLNQRTALTSKFEEDIKEIRRIKDIWIS